MSSGGWRGPGRRVFAAGPGQGSRVRQWMTAAIARHGCPAGLDDTALTQAAVARRAAARHMAGCPLAGEVLLIIPGLAASPVLHSRPADGGAGGRTVRARLFR
jgi:hypothetical protein